MSRLITIIALAVAALASSPALAEKPVEPVEPAQSEPGDVLRSEDADDAGGDAGRADASVARKRVRPGEGWAFLPGVFFSPESGLSGTIAVLRYFRTQAESRPSRIRASVNASTRGDLSANVEPTLWLAHDTVYIKGVFLVSHSERTFWGIGPDTPESAAEDYSAFRFTARVNAGRQILPAMYAGGVAEFRLLNVTDVEEGGLLDSGTVPGSTGSTLASIGAFYRYDNRDNIFYPTQGFMVYTSPRLYHHYLASEFDFLRWFTDARAYYQVAPRHVIALQAKLDLRIGEQPFTFLSETGGSTLLRGIVEGRERDSHFAGGQVEYRTHIAWRIGATAFAGVGRVAPTVGDFDLDHWRWAAGGGLRAMIKKRESLNVRVDFGVSAEGTALYLDILEAF